MEKELRYVIIYKGLKFVIRPILYLKSMFYKKFQIVYNSLNIHLNGKKYFLQLIPNFQYFMKPFLMSSGGKFWLSISIVF